MRASDLDETPHTIRHLWCRDRWQWVLQRWSDGRWAVFERYEVPGPGHAWTVVSGRYLLMSYRRPSADDFPAWVPANVARDLTEAAQRSLRDHLATAW